MVAICVIATALSRAAVAVLALYYVWDAWSRRVHHLVKKFRATFAVFLVVNTFESYVRIDAGVSVFAIFEAVRIPLGYVAVLFAIEHAARNLCSIAHRDYPRFMTFYVPVMRVASVLVLVSVAIVFAVEETNGAQNNLSYTNGAYLLACFLPLCGVYIWITHSLYTASSRAGLAEQETLVDRDLKSSKRTAIIVGILLFLLPILSAYLVLNDLPGPADAPVVLEECESSLSTFWLTPLLYAVLLIVTRHGRTRFERINELDDDSSRRRNGKAKAADEDTDEDERLEMGAASNIGINAGVGEVGDSARLDCTTVSQTISTTDDDTAASSHESKSLEQRIAVQ